MFFPQVVLRMEKKESPRSINHLWALETISKVVLLLSQDVSESRVQSGFQTFGEGLRKSSQDSESAFPVTVIDRRTGHTFCVWINQVNEVRLSYLVPFAQAADLCLEAMLGGLIGELLGYGLGLTFLRPVQYQEAR